MSAITPITVAPYIPLRSCRSEFIPVRGLQYHIRIWGDPAAPQLFLLHGWLDVSMSFQFLVDSLKKDWCVIAPDWRGYGLSEWSKTDAYWFPDYVVDLDFILRHFSPDKPVNLLGHSMGGNVVGIYAGSRPERVRRLINLEGFGMSRTRPEDAPARYRRFMDEMASPPRLRYFSDFHALARRMQKNNPLLPDHKALFLAHHWGVLRDGKVLLQADPAHRLINGTLYKVEEGMACWRAITAPTLIVRATESQMLRTWVNMTDYQERLAHFADRVEVVIDKAGHMLHHDQPGQLAELIETFIDKPSAVLGDRGHVSLKP